MSDHTTIGENELRDLSQKLEDAYEKVKFWPEQRMPGVDITTLGEGFVDLLQLRNLVPEILAAIDRRKDGFGTVSVATDEMIYAAMAKADEIGEPLDDIDAREIINAALSCLTSIGVEAGK